MAILVPRNNALNVHPPTGDQYLTTNGSNWLFTVTSIFGLSTLLFYALKFRARAGERFFHYLFIMANFAGLVAYFAMASDLAWTPVRQANEVGSSGAVRQVFWAKYVFWTVSFGAVTVALGVVSGVSWATVVFDVALAWAWVVSLLVAAYTPSNYKWGFFAFGVLAQALLAGSTLGQGRAARRVGVRGDYLGLAGWANFLWLLYPLVWGLTDGGNYLGVVAGFIWFGILDILLLTGVGVAILVLSSRWDYGRLNLAFTQYGRVPARAGTYPEKDNSNAGAAGAAAPAGGPAV